MRVHTIPFGDNWHETQSHWNSTPCFMCDACGYMRMIGHKLVKMHGDHEREITLCPDCKRLLEEGWLDLVVLTREYSEHT